MQVRNCCRRGGKQEQVNASFFALNHCVELSTSGFILLVQEGLLCLLCVPPCSVELLQVSQAATAASCALELRAAL